MKKILFLFVASVVLTAGAFAADLTGQGCRWQLSDLYGQIGFGC